MIFVKFIFQQLSVLGMVIIGGLIHPFILYPKRKKIWEMRLLPPEERAWYWKFADTSEHGFGTDWDNYMNSTWGLYELVKIRNKDGWWVPDYEKFATYSAFRKFLVSYNWMVFRNGAWNYIISQLPPKLDGDNYTCIINEWPENEGPYSCKLMRNQKWYGKQYLTYPAENPTNFRYSVTKKASWYNLHRLFAFIFTLGKWYTHFNFMWGSTDFRNLIKMRSFKPIEVTGKSSVRITKRDKYLVKGSKHREDY